jgi:hypothetical protein
MATPSSRLLFTDCDPPVTGINGLAIASSRVNATSAGGPIVYINKAAAQAIHACGDDASAAALGSVEALRAAVSQPCHALFLPV